MFDTCGVCIVRTFCMIWICTIWIHGRIRRFGDTSARFAVQYVRRYHIHLSG